jgi:putative ABC transport system permease protein
LPALFSFLALAPAMGILSGVYPVLFQSSFPALELLKENLNPARSNLTLRRLLVVLQFSLSIILIIGVGILFQQLDFMRDYVLGFEQEHVVVAPIDLFGHREPNDAKGIAGAIRDEFSQCTGVISVSLCEEIPGHDAPRKLGFDWKGKDYLPIKQFFIDENYFVTLGMEFVEGRNFSEEFGADVSGDAVILNEAAAKVMGWQSAIGKELTDWRGGESAKVIGIVKDFHFQSLHHVVEPLMFGLRTKNSPYHHYLVVRMNPHSFPASLDGLKAKWHALVPERPFEYFFLDDEFNRNYQTEERWSKIITCAAILAVFIACLGVFGLTAHAVTRRTKEIGIRKVLGASVANVVTLLSKDFVILVLCANIIAWPIAYFALNRWLENFAYRIDIGWWVFVLAGGLALMIALLTVSTQAIKAAVANPVDALRYE